MRIYLSFLLSVATIYGTTAQNLIPNPSFEKVSSKINQSISTSREDFSNKVALWFSPTNVSPDVYKLHEQNSTFPDEFRLPQPVDGDCLAGIITNFYYNVCKTYKEYISIQLTAPLVSQETYRMEFWVTSNETNRYDFGVLFDVDKMELNQCSMLEMPVQFSTQDSIEAHKWKKISFEFKATKPYSYVMIGNFKRSKEAKREYLYLDDFHLAKQPLQEKEQPKQSIPKKKSKPIAIAEIFNPRNILFKHGKYDLLTTSHQELNKLVEYLTNNNQTQLTIEGHTDNSGSATFNQQLSINRAAAIKRYLVTKGIHAGRITVLGYGSNRPMATNETETGRQLNRRVAFKLGLK